MKLSAVIPSYSITPELENMTVECIKSYKHMIDELIVSEDGGNFSQKLFDLADVYLYTKENKGFSVNVNRGWKQSTGDYTAIISTDTYLKYGNIRELCIKGRVTSPTVENQYIPYLAGPFFVVPKEITKARGMLIEELRTYCSDSDYDMRVRDIFTHVESVCIYHHMAKTVTVAGVEGGDEIAKDRATYAKLISEGKATPHQGD